MRIKNQISALFSIALKGAIAPGNFNTKVCNQQVRNGKIKTLAI
jgi:hypothetical protein